MNMGGWSYEEGYGLELVFGDAKYFFILTEYLSQQELLSPYLNVKLDIVNKEPALVFTVPNWFLWFRLRNKKVVFQEAVTKPLLQKLLAEHGEGFVPEFGNFKSWTAST
ncbi:hypothetical protein [Thiomicrorhabdus indica]|uniref:hypothetical protein n=1 Tax=Thiomicrorhabdus indica TaxID=2267253 RepID=UPI00102D846F|nr:hypothetical protein [Thiomicrorhabdus indica]